ncbi:MAG: threonine synthase [Candidatus Dadabacteria bacterium]|nr:threonine synthase [Candidatus Dadabacteria bacterium]NIT13740.1 threonine synthase [Candidatus Dadabacteria bacterium]
MNFVKGLICRECGQDYPKDPIHVCEFCFGPLEVEYDYEKITKSISKTVIQKRDYSIWRYKELLPVDHEPTVGKLVGYTPLIKADNLASALGVRELYIKNDAVCYPTLSFKDRVVSVALSKAKEFGFETVSCASTGNLANAVSALSTSAGLQSFIFIPKDLEQSKIVGSSIYGTNLVEINGHYDDVNRLCSEIAGSFGWGFVNINLRPYYAEGSKSFAFEFIEQLGWKVPDNIVIPMASGSLLTKIWKAINEFKKVGIIDDFNTKIFGAQAKGCSPISTAVKNNWDTFKPQKPDTIAKSISIGNPADGYYAMKAIRDSGGWSEDVTDPEIVQGIKLLAETEGIFTETAGGVTVAVTKKLIDNNQINNNESILVSITGNGLKTLEPLIDEVDMPHTINADIDEFKTLYENITNNTKEEMKKCLP